MVEFKCFAGIEGAAVVTLARAFCHKGGEGTIDVNEEEFHLFFVVLSSVKYICIFNIIYIAHLFYFILFSSFI